MVKEHIFTFIDSIRSGNGGRAEDLGGDVMYTILVVDDSPFIVDVFVTMLEREISHRCCIWGRGMY